MSFNENYKRQLLNNEWEFVFPNLEEKYMINTFDDGNERFESNENKWIVFGKWKEKRAIFNLNNSEIILKSLSNWKISKL